MTVFDTVYVQEFLTMFQQDYVLQDLMSNMVDMAFLGMT